MVWLTVRFVAPQSSPSKLRINLHEALLKPGAYDRTPR